jgi:FkbM family methyltransferase
MSLDLELDQLLSEDILSVRSREKTAFDRLTAPFGKSLVLFGAGNLGRQALERVRSDGIEPLAFSDNDPSKWGNNVDGLKVLSPLDAARNFGHKATIVVTIWSPGSHHQFRETKQKLHSLNCLNVIPFLSLFWKYPDGFLPNNFLDYPHKIISACEEIRKVFHLWADEASQSTFVSQLKWRMMENYGDLPAASKEPQYFPDVIKLSTRETFIDGGAYDGDSLKEFIARTSAKFQAVYAFEPDHFNFEKLAAYVKTLPCKNEIRLYKKALGSRFEKLNFSDMGSASSIININGQSTVDSIPLDDFLPKVSPTFIKMDIEGAELDALGGASKMIQRSEPFLAICVYHRQNHLWKIPLLIHSLSNKYRLFLRAHQEEGWDLVCYAVPSG